MKTIKLFLLTALLAGLVGNTVQTVDSDTDYNVISGANADVNYIYTDADNAREISAAADRDDDEAFEIFPGEEDGSYLYLGMETKFDRVYFDIEGTARMEDSNDEMDMTWQYNDGNSWSDLEIEEDTVDNFSPLGTKFVSFEMPSDWDSFDYENEDAYWIRLRLDTDNLDRSPEVDQISARTYNLEVEVNSDNGENIIGLNADDFDISNGSDNRIYGFRDLDNGKYQFALQTEAVDTTYTLVVEADSYLDYGVALNEMDDDDLMQVDVNLSIERGCETPYTDINYHWSQSAIRELYCRDIVAVDGSIFGVNREITRAEFLKMALLNAGIDTDKYAHADLPFRDVDEDQWYYEYVAAAYSLDLIDGDSTYSPNSSIDRSEAVVLVVRMSGHEGNETSTRYSDVSESSWYAAAVHTATDFEVVEGYPNRQFKPSNSLTRAEAAVVINNAYYVWYDGK